MGVCTKIWTATAVLILAVSCILARPSGPEATDEQRESRTSNGFKAEHRSAPPDEEILDLRYYGGAEGNVLVHHPSLGFTPVLKQQTANKNDDDNVGEEDGPAGGGGGSGNGDADDAVTIQLPPPGASVAEARPVGLSIAGIGGVAASKPTGTAVVGPGGLAIARPVATAIAGVPPDAVLGTGPQGPSQQPANSRKAQSAEETYVAVGPQNRPGATYRVIPAARNVPVQTPVYVRIQPHSVRNSVQYTHQPLLLYPVAYY